MNESLADFRFKCENKSLEELKELAAHMDTDAARQAEFEDGLECKLPFQLIAVSDEMERSRRRVIVENQVRHEMGHRRICLRKIIEQKEQWALRGALLARGVLPLSGGTVAMPSHDEVFAKVRAELEKLKASKIQPELSPSDEPTSAIEIERANERLTGRTTMALLVADYGIPESTIGGWLRDWERIEKISNSRPQKMNTDDVKFVRAALQNLRKQREARGAPSARFLKNRSSTDAAPKKRRHDG